MTITGRGTVVTGRIEQGIVKVGDDVEIVGLRALACGRADIRCQLAQPCRRRATRLFSHNRRLQRGCRSLKMNCHAFVLEA